MTQRSGRCLCGAVNFRLLSDPLAVRVCWCRDCQHLAANGTVNAVIATDHLQVSGHTAEHASTVDSGNTVTRVFCPVCGTHLFAWSSARPQFRGVRVGNLDDPSSVAPLTNIWTSSAPVWACLDPALERVDLQPGAPQPSPSQS